MTLRDKRTSLDYAYRPEINQGDSYADFIRKIPDKAMQDQNPMKHSEFKKPYRADSYQDMEYQWDGTLGEPKPDEPWPDILYPNKGKRKPSKLYNCFVTECYSAGTTTEVPFYCTGQCRAVDITHKAFFTGYTITGKCNSVNITAPAAGPGGVMTPIDFGVQFPDGIKIDNAFTVYGCHSRLCFADDQTTATTIGYTTQQMALNGTQSLNVVSGRTGGVFTWAVTAGGGSVSPETGTSTTYTAPATNPECANNPTITLSDGGNACDTLQIAVSAEFDTNTYAYYRAYTTGFESGCGTGAIYKIIHYCNGTERTESLAACDSCDCNGMGGCDGCHCEIIYAGEGGGCAGGNWLPDYAGFFCTAGDLLARCTDEGKCGTYSEIPIACSGTTDIRTAAAKTAGCCPAALL